MAACPREQNQQSAHSPGVVRDEETLLYVLREPTFYEGGQLTPAAFSTTELKECRLSVCRHEVTPLELVQKFIIEPFLKKDAKRSVSEGLLAPCAVVRSILVHGTQARAYCVVDDGDADLPGHTVICFSEDTKAANFWGQVPNGKTAVRSQLTECFKEKISLWPAR